MFDCPLKQKSSPTVTKVVDLPEAKALGASTLFTSRESWYLLISDSPEGIIWRLDLKSGEYNPALSDDSMSPAPNGPAMGVNGIKIFDRYLYYASVTRKELRRVKLDGAANAIGPYELVMEDIGVDNLDISVQGDIYLAVNTENLIMSITAEGKLVQVAGGKDSTALAGPTCCVLRPGVDELFVGTNGGIFAPVDDWFEEPGKVSAIRI
jgi:sugar lactone lactonase YvrE